MAKGISGSDLLCYSDVIPGEAHSDLCESFRVGAFTAVFDVLSSDIDKRAKAFYEVCDTTPCIAHWSFNNLYIIFCNS
ncbi:hypothetical protein LSAT2_017949 [Lamellibrachia satsuma]|nr:hypothetical protein LSAT2_017949 [Lamellibrachia satsuma]